MSNELNTSTRAVLRYPGGKAKAIRFIRPFWEQVKHLEYREPFVGGGSVFLSKPKVSSNWLNDKDKDLIAFYKTLKDSEQRVELVEKLLKLKVTRDTYDDFYYSKPTGDFDKALRYYFLNRCSFSGITRWNAYIGDVRYNISRSAHLFEEIGSKLQRVKLTSKDFEEIIAAPSNRSTFMFVDPPYAESRQVAAYNVTFVKEDHLRLAKLLEDSQHKFLLTYDDCKFVRKLYSWAYLYDRTWTYSVANARIHHNPRESGNELFISNFPLDK